MKSVVIISQESVLSTSLPPIWEDKERYTLAQENRMSAEQLARIQKSRETLQLGIGQGEQARSASQPPLDISTLARVTEGIG